MITQLRRFTDRLGRWRTVAVLAVPTLLLMGVFNFHPAAVPYLQKAGNGVPPLDIQLGYGPRDVDSLFSNYGVEGRQRYALFLLADLAFAACYGLLLAGLLRLALRPPVATVNSRWNDLCVLPLLAACGDIVENLSILGLLAVYPSLPAMLVYLASVATIIKWSAAAIGIAAILIAFGARLALLNGRAGVQKSLDGGHEHDSAG